MDTVFKQPVVQAEPQARVEVDKPDSTVVPTTIQKDTNIPLEQYKAENDSPYAEKFFKMDTPFNYLPAKVQDKLNDIDKYVDYEITQRGLKHNTVAYETILSELGLELGAQDESVSEQIDRFAGYADSILTMQGVESVAKELKSKLRKMRSSKEMKNEMIRMIGKRIL